MENTVGAGFYGKNRRLITPVLILLVSGIVYSQYGIHGHLDDDDALFVYTGQQLVRGVPPYKSFVDNKGPGTVFITGFGVYAARLLNADDLLTVRALYLIISCLAAVSVYYYGKKLFDNERTGILAAIIFLVFFGFGKHALSGPRPKTPIVLLTVIVLYLIIEKRWFLAGFFSSVSTIIWQPTGVYFITALTLAYLQSGQDRWRNALKAAAGFILPMLVMSAYFIVNDAFYEMLDGLLMYNIQYASRRFEINLQRAKWSLGILDSFLPYAIRGFPVILVLYAVIFVKNLRREKSIYSVLSKDAFMGLYMTLTSMTIFSLFDFQGYPDFFVFLPFIAVGLSHILNSILDRINRGFGLTGVKGNVLFLILCVYLAVYSGGNYKDKANYGLNELTAYTEALKNQVGEDTVIYSFNKAQPLVLLRRDNPNPYLSIATGRLKRIDEEEPGGFDGWLREMGGHESSIIFAAEYALKNAEKEDGGYGIDLRNWLELNYRKSREKFWDRYDKRPLNTMVCEGCNVILISADSLSADRMDIYGYDRKTTPKINRFFRRRSIFNGISPTPCAEEGLLSINAGRFDLGGVGRTIAENLQEQGYYTAEVVSLMDDDMQMINDVGRGFSYKGIQWNNRHDSAKKSPGKSRMITRSAMDWLDENYDRGKFFLWVHYSDLQNTEPSSRGYYEIRDENGDLTDETTGRGLLYDSELHYLDQRVGLLLRRISELGLTENTVVILTSSNGKSMEDYVYPAGCGSLKEDNVNVPILVSVGGKKLGKYGRTTHHVTSTLDIYPTLMGVLDIEYDEGGVDGVDIQTTPANRKAFAIMEDVKALRYARWKLYYENDTPTRFYYIYGDREEEVNMINETDNIIYGYMRRNMDKFIEKRWNSTVY
ncbi:MAG: sulfatase-like hydrolase/transferase [Candidatus Altiarchaeota archaeon]